MEQDRSFCSVSHFTEPEKEGKRKKSAEQFIFAESKPESQKLRNPEIQ